MAFTQVPLFGDNDAFDLERANAIVSNLNYLNESKVTVRYNAYGTVQTDSIKIACGTTSFENPNGPDRNRAIAVGGFFTPGTRPVVTTAIATDYFVSHHNAIRHRSGSGAIIDNTGFFIRVKMGSAHRHVKFTGPNYIHWMMIGY